MDQSPQEAKKCLVLVNAENKGADYADFKHTNKQASNAARQVLLLSPEFWVPVQKGNPAPHCTVSFFFFPPQALHVESLNIIFRGFEILSWQDIFSAAGGLLEFSSILSQAQHAAKVFKYSNFSAVF